VIKASANEGPPGVLDHVLAWVGDDDPETMAAKMLAFRRYMLVHLAVEGWFRYMTELSHRGVVFAFALIFTMCMGLGLFRGFNRAAVEIVAVAVPLQIAWGFPYVPSHVYLEGLVVILLALFDPAKDEETSVALAGLRWMSLLVLFWGGLKKLFYGYYFDGTFFGQMVGFDPRFKEFFSLVLTPEEHLRLVRLFWPGPLGAGPYTVDSSLVVAMANLAWILGLLLPLGLLVGRLRPLAMAVSILLSIAVALVTREVFLAALLVNLMLLYARRDLNRRLLPLFLLLFAWLLLIAVGVLPKWGLS
jgi:hypothetical protein